MQDKCYTVYMHICPNNKKYIGITKQEPKERWLKGKGYKKQYFENAIKKYGWDNIKHKIILSGIAKDIAEQKEIELISYYKTNDKKFGYNIEKGGHVNCVSQETKEKISKTMKEKKIYKNNPNCFKKGIKPWITGKKHTQEAKMKIKQKRANQIIQSNKVLCVETNEIFGSAKQVEEKYGFNAKSIRKVCSGERITAYNYHWEYIKK